MKGYNPELPVLQSSLADVLLKHLLHVVDSLASHRNACVGKLGLHNTERKRKDERNVICGEIMLNI